jgi:hypothetical protein
VEVCKDTTKGNTISVIEHKAGTGR